VSREHTPVPGKWYENKEEEETFRVLSVDEDDELVEIEYLDGEKKKRTMTTTSTMTTTTMMTTMTMTRIWTKTKTKRTER
jgi:hypothetical protein